MLSCQDENKQSDSGKKQNEKTTAERKLEELNNAQITFLVDNVNSK